VTVTVADPVADPASVVTVAVMVAVPTFAPVTVADVPEPLTLAVVAELVDHATVLVEHPDELTAAVS
jgi:hypothetical protein